MKVLVLNTPYLPMYSRASRSPAVTKSSTLYYPYWLAYCTGVLEQEGFDVKFIDAPAMMLEHKDIYEIAKKFSPDLTVVDTTTPSIYNDIEVGKTIKELCGSKVILVGTHVSALPEESISFDKSIDAVACGEYDYIVRDFAVALRDRDDLTKVKGLVLRLEDGKIVKTPPADFIEDLDSIPFASKIYLKHFNEKIIRRYFYGECLAPVMTIITGRGCPHRCSFCVYPQVMMGHKYRYRSIKNVVDEMEFIKEEFPYIREIFMEDDTLTVNRKRTKDLADEILKRNLKVVWSANSRADVDFETLKVMKESGCRLLCVGFESGDQRILDNIHKNIKLEQIYKFADDAKRAGIKIHGCFLVGNQGETKETLDKTLKMALQLNPDTAQFYPIMVYPGTEAYEWAKKNNYLQKSRYDEWLTPDGLHNSVVSTEVLSWDELVEWCDYARERFYLRPRYILSKLVQAASSPGEFVRLYRGGKTLFKYMLRYLLKKSKLKKQRQTC